MKTLLSAIVLLITSCCLAQKAPAKFGNVPREDIEMTSYAPDSSAEAVVLVDFGESSFRYDMERGFVLIFERLRRVKILKPDGLDYANLKIRTFHSGQSKEKILSLKGMTYNLENGKIVETKLKNESIFKEDFDKNWEVTTVTLPNVKVGSVIDISYTIDSDFFSNLIDWEFQSRIPTVWSEYRTRIPEYFSYEKYAQGYIAFALNESTTAPGNITLRWKSRSEGLTTSTSFEEQKVDFIENRFRWAAENVPAFRDEPFLAAANDYISRINFELAYVKMPQSPIQNYMGSWDEICKTYNESDDFGGEVKGNGFLKKTVEEITAGMVSAPEKVAAIVNYVKENVAWTGRSRSFSASRLKKVLDEKKGNSAEINLLLTSMLDKAGFEAHPVLISTRDHGFIRESYPNSTQFNYVLALVTIDGKDWLLDATEPLLPPNVLPERCLNGQGLVVSKGPARWVSLVAPQKSKTSAIAKLVVTPDGKLDGELVVDRSGYTALEGRKMYLQKGEDDYLKELSEELDCILSESSFENTKKINEQFREKHHVEVPDHVTSAGEVLYVNPFIALQKKANPFKLEKREYPIDFAFPSDEIYMVTITIPEGYVVDELPESKILMLPQNASRYAYQATRSGNNIVVVSNFAINKPMFTQLEYAHIREFYNQVVAKQSQQIVLKKQLN